jgi:rubrerythrin
MSKHYEKHAVKVVKTFKDLLGKKCLKQIDDEHFSELEMLIESAISTSVLKELERAADKTGELSKMFKKRAERYDD